MPRKITNPLRAGLPAKIYLLAYGSPITGYRIAQKIYDRDYAPTSKIYPWTKKLEKKGTITKTQKGILSKVEPLLLEIEKMYPENQQFALTEFEKYILLKVLDSKEFRSILKEKVVPKIKLQQDVDAARIILETLGMITSQALLAIKMTNYDEPEPKTKKEFDKLWAELSAQTKKEAETKIDEYNKETKQAWKNSGFKELDPSDKEIFEHNIGFSTKFEPFLAVPKVTLEKISSLFPLSSYFQSFVYSLFRGMTVLLEKYMKNGQATKKE